MDVGHPVMGFLLWSQMSESFRFPNSGILKKSLLILPYYLLVS